MSDQSAPAGKWTSSTRIRTAVILLGGLLWICFKSEYSDALTQEFKDSALSCTAPTPDHVPENYPAIYSAIQNRIRYEAASQVRIVAIKDNLEEIQQNVCLGREYLARLVQAIDAQHPRVLVIDKYFSPGACRNDPASTQHLQYVLQTLSVPVVIGESTDTVTSDSISSQSKSCLVSKPQFPWNSPRVHLGLSKLNVNREQIPLIWPVLPASEKMTGDIKPQPRNTLSLEAVRLFAPDLYSKKDFQSMLDKGRDPYAQFSETYHPVSSAQVLCSSGLLTGNDPTKLACSPQQTAPPLDMNGKIVLIGAENNADLWPVLGRRLYGFELQAHYIDALLSGHYLQSAPPYQIILIFAGFLIVTTALPWLLGKRKNELSGRMHSVAAFLEQWSGVLFPPVYLLIVAAVLVLSGYLPPIGMMSTIASTYITLLITVEGPRVWASYSKHPDNEGKPKAMGATA